MSQMSWDLSNASTQVEPEKKPAKKSEKNKESSRKILSVSQLNGQIRGQLETAFPRFWLKGELSNFTAHGSGHWYFSLKDNKSQISGVMFRGQNGRVKFKPKTGQEVIVFGRISVYEPRGNYQVYVEHMEPVGAGALQQQFEELKKKLRSEGLFEEQHKQALPEHPKHIAVVTSPTGAAIRDMLNVLRRRYRSAVVTIVPTVVQGEAAAPHIVKALKLAQKIKDVDVIIVGRGGGSMEDLWCFNDEKVAREIFACKVPVISAVGHEIDFTISDFVADLRAPTPSAAAELVAANSEEVLETLNAQKRSLVIAMQNQLRMAKASLREVQLRLVDPRRTLSDFVQRCDELQSRLQRSMKSSLQRRRLHVDGLKRGLVHPRDILNQSKQTIQNRMNRLQLLMNGQLEKSRARIEKNMSLLDSISPLRVLDRGYALVQKNKTVVKSFKQIKKGDEVNVRVAEGSFTAVVADRRKQDEL